MAQYKLTKRNGCYYVTGLKNDFGDTPMLIQHYPEGDINVVSSGPSDAMHAALYDLYQVIEGLHEGDEFLLNGKVVYRCVGVHVVRAGVCPVCGDSECETKSSDCGKA